MAYMLMEKRQRISLAIKAGKTEHALRTTDHFVNLIMNTK